MGTQSTQVYETRHGNLVSEYTEIITQVERGQGELRVTRGWMSDGEPKNLSTVIISEKGVFNLIEETPDVTMLAPILKFPLKPGESWVLERGPDPFDMPFLRTTWTVSREEEIEVPAGRFKTIRIDCIEEIGEASYRSRHWHSPAVGLVKRIEEEQTEVLKSFKNGRSGQANSQTHCTTE